MLDVLKEAISIARRKRAEKADRVERCKIAKAFNDRYTYRKQWVPDMPRLGGTHYGAAPKAGYAWMCPDCNAIHHPTKNSVFSGLQYPACCRTGDGNRLNHGIKTGV